MKPPITVAFPPEEGPSHNRALKNLEIFERSALVLFRGAASRRRRLRQQKVMKGIETIRDLIEFDEYLKTTQNSI